MVSLGIIDWMLTLWDDWKLCMTTLVRKAVAWRWPRYLVQYELLAVLHVATDSLPLRGHSLLIPDW